jgi:hypothetical protein
MCDETSHYCPTMIVSDNSTLMYKNCSADSDSKTLQGTQTSSIAVESWRNKLMIRILRFLAVLCLMSTGAEAATIQAASCSSADVQTAINNASNGDTVRTPGPCSVSWGSRVSIPNTKGITVDGGGNTTLTSFAFNLNQNGASTSRITGFIITNGAPAANQSAITTKGSPTSATCRIDHNNFPATAANATFITTSGNAPCLIDHNTFSAPGAPDEFIHNFGLGSGDTSGWVDSVIPGGPAMVFVEDNTFTNNDSTYLCSGVQSYYGARTVVRHNSFVFCQVDQHGTPGMVGARWWEIYENTFNANGRAQCCYMAIRAGSGVIFNNHKTGTNKANGSIDLFEEDSGTWPLAFQIGSGMNGQTDGHSTCSGVNSSPAYVWGNDSTIPVTSQSGPVQVNRDYFLSAPQPSSMRAQQASGDSCSTTYNYVPYTYPHPLVSGATGTALQPPTNLRPLQ